MALPPPQVLRREALQSRPRGVSPRLQFTRWPLVTAGASASASAPSPPPLPSPSLPSPGLRLKRALFLLPVCLVLAVTVTLPPSGHLLLPYRPAGVCAAPATATLTRAVTGPALLAVVVSFRIVIYLVFCVLDNLTLISPSVIWIFQDISSVFISLEARSPLTTTSL